MSKSVLVSDQTYASLKEYADASGSDIKSAADKVMGTGFSRMTALLNYSKSKPPKAAKSKKEKAPKAPKAAKPKPKKEKAPKAPKAVKPAKAPKASKASVPPKAAKPAKEKAPKAAKPAKARSPKADKLVEKEFDDVKTVQDERTVTTILTSQPSIVYEQHEDGDDEDVTDEEIDSLDEDFDDDGD